VTTDHTAVDHSVTVIDANTEKFDANTCHEKQKPRYAHNYKVNINQATTQWLQQPSKS